MTIKVGNKFFLEVTENGLHAGTECYASPKLSDVAKLWTQNLFDMEDMDGQLLYEVQVTRKFKAKDSGISFEEVSEKSSKSKKSSKTSKRKVK